MKLEGSLPSNEKRAINMHTNKINSDSSERKYVHLSNGLIQGYGICSHLQYEYAQVAVDLFYENFTPVHCSVAVCIHVLPFFLYLKECVIILKFGSAVSCGLTRETRLTKNKAIA